MDFQSAKVVWLVYKDKNRLFRVEGGEYHYSSQRRRERSNRYNSYNMDYLKAPKLNEGKLWVILHDTYPDAKLLLGPNIL